ncbi:LAFE_0E12200g1_1 [Lachancea fermentati]|uniref:LAFE_0E12200g1_1 n=1 Tax=Lachancea fermentati TaxID=4955 RepID=A0A1G4MDP6_LACFM|nr:LAFE_0E12200g1_1 [Lachancea fermentati]
MNTGYTFPPAASDDKETASEFKFPRPSESIPLDVSEVVNEEPAAKIDLDVGETQPKTISIDPVLETIEDIGRSSTPIPETVGSKAHQDGEQTVDAEPISAVSSNRSFANEYATSIRQQLATDWKSPSEYALHILFTKFVRHAESMLNLCLEHPLDSEPPIVDILGEGVDQTFDSIIESLGYISKKKPKPVIDAMMFWRKTKSEVAAVAADNVERSIRDYEQMRQNYGNQEYLKQTAGSTPNSKTFVNSSSSGSRSFHRRNNSSRSSNSTTSFVDSKLRSMDEQIEAAKETAFQADRKSLISIFILCRVLIEIVKQTPDDADEDLNDKLEEIVFTQLKTTDPISISSSIIKSSNWNSFAELLGCMSEKKFVAVSDRFIADLEKLPNYISREMEPSVHLLILGMRYLRLKNYPLEQFEESADFIKSIAKFFSTCQNFSVRLAYAEVISQLLLPLAGSVTAEVNHPTWVEAMTMILSTCKKLQNDNKFWSSAFKLTVSVLSVSPQSLFTENWVELTEKNVTKIKSKRLDERVTFAVCLSRLVWVYLFRCTETLNNTERSLKRLFTLFLSTKKKDNWITAEMDLINPLTDVLVTIGWVHPVFILENVIIPLIRMSFNGSTLDNLGYERLILAIDSYRGLLMSNERPEFPDNESRFYEMNLNKISSNVSKSVPSDHEEICKYFYKMFLLLDSTIGSEVWSPENEHQRQPSTPFSSISSFNFGFTSETSNNNNRNLNIALFATLIEVIPCCLAVSGSIPFKSTIEILARNAAHGDLLIATSAQNALKALASKKNPYTLITWFAKYSFDFDEKTQSSYNMSYLSSIEYRRLLVLYVELLQCWLDEFKSSSKEEMSRSSGLDGIQLPFKEGEESHESTENEKLEWKNTVTVIEDVEGNGLFFLCSHDHSIRRLAIQILKLVSKFDEAMLEKTCKMERSHSRSSSRFVAESGTRLIDLLNDYEYTHLLDPKRSRMSVAEKSRITKLSMRYKSGVLVRLAESDYGVDAALWHRMFPKLLSVIFERAPITMALCRSIVCIRLVQLHEIILSIANNIPNKFKETLPEVIVNQWKLYLIVSCSSLTSTNDQKLHIPTTNLQHGRNKSQQIFTVQHQKINSATSIFKMVLPLLNSQKTIVKDAIITGLSSMNINIYKAYIENIDRFLTTWRADSSSNNMRVEMFHILAILAPFLSSEMLLQDEWILKKISQYLKETKKFLEAKETQCSFHYQPLRRYFASLLSSYYLAIKRHPLMEELFPFEARASCLNFLKEWCGYGQYSSTSKERYDVMKGSEHTRDRSTLVTAIEFERSKLEIVALETMVNLCSDSITKTIYEIPDTPILISFDIAGLMSWIDALFSSREIRIKNFGVSALKNLLENNKSNSQLYKNVLMQYSLHNLDTSVASLYYSAVCESLLNMENLILPEEDLVSLGLSGLYNENSEVRSYSIDLLSVIETKIHKSSYTKVFKERLANDSKTVYKSTAKEISTIFAELPSSEVRLQIFSKMCQSIEFLKSELKQDILILLVPWVHKFVLKSVEHLGTFMVLSNLFAITVELNDRYPMETEQLWISLGKGNGFQNIHVALDYIMTTSINYRNPGFVNKAKDVILYLANVPSGMGVIDSFLINLEPKHMIPETFKSAAEPINDGRYAYIANIWTMIRYRGKEVIFSKAQLSIVFLVNLLTIPNESMRSKLPLLLHICISLLDHYAPIIQESAAKIISDLIFGLAPTHEKSEETVALIKDRNQLWAYDNLLKDKRGARSPKAMDSLVRNIVTIFSSFDTLQIEWQRIALKWSTTCPVRHIACRSFQIFRSLLTFLDQQMLRDMLHRLSNTISDENSDIQGFAMQILMTLNAMTAELDPAKLIDFPQLFWSVVACLSSIHEQEFIEVLSTLSKFVSKIDLDSPDTVQCLIATFPSTWEGKFDGLQQIIMCGLRSANSWDISLDFLDRLNLFHDSRIIANSESRVLFALLANLPRFLHAMDTNGFNSDIMKAAEALIVLANSNQQLSLARLVDSLSKNKFRSKKDFLSQVVSFISGTFFPDYSAQTLVFLLGLLFNDIDWVKIQTLQLLKYIFPLIDLTRPEFTGVGADLISPLLRLLLTEYEPQALEVLNSVQNVSGSKMDKDVLRISMGNKDAKKAYSRTATLFGIPEPSGWSVPMPAMTAATTRHNVHAVFTTCLENVGEESTHQEPESLGEIVEFHADGGYVPVSLEGNDAASVVEDKDGSLSHMWAELDNLDTFFTTEAAATESDIDSKYSHHIHTNSSDTTHIDQTTTLDSAPQLYDKKVSVILNRSLTRTPSNVSFKTNLADSFGTSMKGGPSVMDNLTSHTSRSHIYGTKSNARETSPPSTKTPQPVRSPSRQGLSVASPARNRTSDNPPELLFRFEGLLRNPHRGKKKWQQQQQQQQQLLAQSIHEQQSAFTYDQDTSFSSSPTLGNRGSPPLSPALPENSAQNANTKESSKSKTMNKQPPSKTKHQKHHYHLPHFSNRSSDGKSTPPLSSSSNAFTLRSTPSPRSSKFLSPGIPSSSHGQFSKMSKIPTPKTRTTSSNYEASTVRQSTPVQKLMQDRNIEDDLLIERQLLSLQDELQNRSVSSDSIS